MNRKQFNIRLPEFHINQLKQLATLYNLSQSEVVMMLIDQQVGRNDGSNQNIQIQDVSQQE